MPRQRYHVETRDIPPVAAARMLGLTEERFKELLPDLLKRKFPPADATTGNFDKVAITKWQDIRHPGLLLPVDPTAPQSPERIGATTRERMRAMAAGKER